MRNKVVCLPSPLPLALPRFISPSVPFCLLFFCTRPLLFYALIASFRFLSFVSFQSFSWFYILNYAYAALTCILIHASTNELYISTSIITTLACGTFHSLFLYNTLSLSFAQGNAAAGAAAGLAIHVDAVSPGPRPSLGDNLPSHLGIYGLVSSK